MLTFHISLKTSDFWFPLFFFCWSQNFFFEYVPEFLNMYLNFWICTWICILPNFLTLKWKLDSVKDQVFIEVEKNPVLYHNLLTLNFNTDLGSKWALRWFIHLKGHLKHYFMVIQGVKKVLGLYQVIFLEKSYSKSVWRCLHLQV